MKSRICMVLALFVVFTMAVSLVGCGKKEENPLIGEWEMIGDSDYSGDVSGFYFQTLNEDGTFSTRRVYLDTGDHYVNGTYTVNDNVITFTAFKEDGGLLYAVSYSYGINGDTMTQSEIAGATYFQDTGDPSHIMVYLRVD